MSDKNILLLTATNLIRDFMKLAGKPTECGSFDPLCFECRYKKTYDLAIDFLNNLPTEAKKESLDE